MKLVRMLAFSVALVLVASELSQLAAAGNEPKKKGAKKTVDSKVKRTITVKATKPPPPEPEAQAQEAPPPEQPEMNVGLHNEGPTNTIDMQPSISIGTPMPQAPVAQRDEVVEASLPQQPQQTQTPAPPPPQQQPQVQAVAPNPIQVDQGPMVESGDAGVKANEMPVLSNVVEQQTMLNQANNQLLTSIMDSNNLQARVLANSNNQLMEQSEGNNNMKHTVLKNSGNTEQVHIDGVGNSKITHIANANNHEHHSVTNGPPQQRQPTTTITSGLGRQLSSHFAASAAGMPALIEINVNTQPFLGQARAPMVMLPDGSQWPAAVNPQVIGYPAGPQMAPQASVNLQASGPVGVPQPEAQVLPQSPGQAPTLVMVPQSPPAPAPVFLPAGPAMPVIFPAPLPLPMFHPFPGPSPVPMPHPFPAPHLVPILHPLPLPMQHPVFHPHHQPSPDNKRLEKAAKRAKKSFKKINKKMSKLEKRQKRLEESNKSEKELPEPTPNPNPTPTPNQPPAPVSTESKPETQQPAQQQDEQPRQRVVATPAEAQWEEGAEEGEEDEQASSTSEDTGESPQLEETQESPETEEPEGGPEEPEEGGYVMKMIRVPVEKARDNYSRIHGLNRKAEAATDAANSFQVPSIGDNMRSPVQH